MSQSMVANMFADGRLSAYPLLCKLSTCVRLNIRRWDMSVIDGMLARTEPHANAL